MPGARAFTLLEILLALALIGLLAGVLVSASVRLMGNRPVTPEEVFWKASGEARKAALKSEQEVRLQFDDKEGAFVVSGGGKSQRFPVSGGPDLKIDFLPPPQNGRSSVLIGGLLVETQTLPSVSYYSDGTCMPFRVQFHATGPARILSIDPWTCAEVLTPADPNAF
jgi:general secretion pathway protein H